MAVTHSTAARTLTADQVCGLLNVGGAGKIVLQTAASATVATLTFSATAFGAASSGVATANAITSDPSAVGGVVTKAELRNFANTAVILCSVTATGGGGDITLNNTTITAGQVVAISSLTYTAPA